MPVSTPHISRTAERAFGNRTFLGCRPRTSSAPFTEKPRGHGTYIGESDRRAPEPKPPMPGHRQFSGPQRDAEPIDRQTKAIAERDHERRRRDIWANCERRPIAMDRNPT